MTGAPSLPEAEKAVAEAKAHLDVAAGAADPVVQRDRFKQAAQRLGYATRILEALATPSPSEGGVPLNFGAVQAPSRAPVFGA
jgi:hypothetical protein